jgi:hypothetical protein
MAARDSSGVDDLSWSGSEPLASVPEFPCCECQSLTHKQRFLIVIVAGRMERPAKCQCLTSSPGSNASVCSQSAISSSSPSEPSYASNNQNTTNTKLTMFPPVPNDPPKEGRLMIVLRRNPTSGTRDPSPTVRQAPIPSYGTRRRVFGTVLLVATKTVPLNQELPPSWSPWTDRKWSTMSVNQPMLHHPPVPIGIEVWPIILTN